MNTIKITADNVDNALSDTYFDISSFWDTEEQTPYSADDMPERFESFIASLVGYAENGSAALLDIAAELDNDEWENQNDFNPISEADVQRLRAEFVEQCWSEISTAISDLKFSQY